MNLLTEVERYLQSCIVPAKAGAMMGSFRRQLLTVAEHPQVAPARLPVSDILDDLCQADLPLLKAINSASVTFAWRQNPNYQNNPGLAHFRHNYGYVEFIGPHGPALSTEIRCGILLMNAHTHYPKHSHEAREFYVTLAGKGLWQRGSSNEWRVEPAGHIIYHPAWLPHATKTVETPLLALYCWLGQVIVEAKLLN